MLPLINLSSMSWILISFLMCLSQIQGEVIQNELSIAWMNCPEGSEAFYNKIYCYILFLTPTNWIDANIACQNQHLGHLASIYSRSEASFLANLIKREMITYSDVWIGLHDPTEGHKRETGWEWSSKDELYYRGWEKRPPSIQNAAFCASVTQRSGYKKWKAYDCKKKLPYVCKFKHYVS